MASFSFEAGVQGAAAGAGAGALFGGVGAIPGAVIGFALGGFMGGKAEDAAKQREARLQFLASPQHFMDVTRQVAPQQIALANRSVGPAAASAAATQSARRGLTGTGLGAALATNAAAAPGIAGAKSANAVASGIVNRELAALGGTPIPGIVGHQMGGLPGDSASQLGSLIDGLSTATGGGGKNKNLAPGIIETPSGDVRLPPIGTASNTSPLGSRSSSSKKKSSSTNPFK